MRHLFVLLALTGAAGCSAPEVPTDASGGIDAATRCRVDADCDDHAFCNGPERCAPDTGGADARGCVAGASPCTAASTCDETMDRCGSGCATPDADGDRHDSVTCGGDDCDDADSHRAPGLTEVCDVAGLDEDCDPSTFGIRDADGDTYADATCCNGTRCGPDCDDTSSGAHPGLAETCDLRDNDCDDATDEGVVTTYYLDADGDGFGVDATVVEACSLPAGYAIQSGDCDDGAGGANPGVPENPCNGIDDDCDLQTDEGAVMVTCSVDGDDDGYAAAGAASTMRMCACMAGETSRVPVDAASTDCADNDALAHPGLAELQCNGRNDDCIDATLDERGTEVCDGVTNDCDSSVDEGFGCVQGSVAPCHTSCDPGGATTGSQTCQPNCTLGACVPPLESCDGRDNDCDGAVDDGSPCTPRSGAMTCTDSCGNFSGRQACSDSCQPSGACTSQVDRTFTQSQHLHTACGFPCCGAAATGYCAWCSEAGCTMEYGSGWAATQYPVGNYEASVSVHARGGGSFTITFDLQPGSGGVVLFMGGTPPPGATGTLVTNGMRFTFPGDDVARTFILNFQVQTGCAFVGPRVIYDNTTSCTGTSGAICIDQTRIRTL